MKTIIKMATLTLSLSVFLPVQSASAATFTSFTSLGQFFPDASFSSALGVSPDGSQIVGLGTSSNGVEAFKYQNGTLSGIGDLPGGFFDSVARQISADGSTIVGTSNSSSTALTFADYTLDGYEAFAYRGGQMTGLGFLPGGTNSEALSVSGDGNVIVGYSRAGSLREAFIHQDGIMSGLGFLSGGTFSGATRITPDGSTIIGYSDIGNDNVEAFRYQNGVMTGLGDLEGGRVSSTALDVSGDGKFIVGGSSSANGYEAFLIEEGEMIGLGDISGGSFFSVAYGVSDDGKTVVGWGASDRDFEAVIWDESRTAQRAQDALLADGFDITDQGWGTLSQVTEISADGSTIVGVGSRNGKREAWMATLAPATVVPLPGAVWLFLTAITALLVFRNARPESAS